MARGHKGHGNRDCRSDLRLRVVALLAALAALAGCASAGLSIVHAPDQTIRSENTNTENKNFSVAFDANLTHAPDHISDVVMALGA